MTLLLCCSACSRWELLVVVDCWRLVRMEETIRSSLDSLLISVGAF